MLVRLQVGEGGQDQPPHLGLLGSGAGPGSASSSAPLRGDLIEGRSAVPSCRSHSSRAMPYSPAPGLAGVLQAAKLYRGDGEGLPQGLGGGPGRLSIQRHSRTGRRVRVVRGGQAAGSPAAVAATISLSSIRPRHTEGRARARILVLTDHKGFVRFSTFPAAGSFGLLGLAGERDPELHAGANPAADLSMAWPPCASDRLHDGSPRPLP